MAQTPVGKRVKRAYLTAVLSIGSGVGEQNASYGFQFQEDVRIIGWQLRVSGKPEGALTESEGVFYANGTLSPAVGAEPPILAELPLIVRMYTGTGGNPVCGNWVEHMEMMFPDGYGVDLDTHEYLYVGLTAENEMHSNNVAIACVARVYYVER